ncbi:MAG TPA: CDP-diacylglycerol diphosphatase [Stellaceae bacterium]|nr:CDP-diacylglycerol diphosphatase [Stellaceae bacterium]
MRLYRARPGLAVLILLAAAAGACAAAEPTEPRSKLWTLVQRCIAHPEMTGPTDSCLLADPAKGYAILRDIRGQTQFLLVATDRRWGIEDPRIEPADAPNYFAAAWSARGCVAAALGRPVPDGEISLAINSTAARSDGQLHIHIDRLRPGVSDALERGKSEVTLAGHRYRLRHLDTIADTNLFAALAATASGAMGDQTIVVAGDPRGGFFVLDDHVHDGDPASGEELQVDHPPVPLEQLAAEQKRLAGCADPARPEGR